MDRRDYDDYTAHQRHFDQSGSNSFYAAWKPWLEERNSNSGRKRQQAHEVTAQRNHIVMGYIASRPHLSREQRRHFIRSLLCVQEATDAIRDDIKADPMILTIPGMGGFAADVIAFTDKVDRVREWSHLLSGSWSTTTSTINATFEVTETQKASPDMFKTTSVRTINGWVGQVLYYGSQTDHTGTYAHSNDPLIVWQSEPVEEDQLNSDGNVVKTAKELAEKEATARVDEVVAAQFTGQSKRGKS